MSEIQLYKQSELAEIPKADNEIALALNSPMIKDLDAGDFYDTVSQSVTKAYILAKYEMPHQAELSLIVEETRKYLQNKFGTIRKDEIEVMFSRGLAKEYGDYMGLSFITFTQFAKGYMNEPSRSKLLTPVKTETMQPTPEQRLKIAKDLALATLQKFIQGHSIEAEGATVYRFLARLKIIEYSDQEQAEFMASAESEVIAKKQREKFTSMDKHVRATIERELENTTLLADRIKLQAQHNGLLNYFQELSFEDEPIAELNKQITEKAQKFLNR